MRHMQRIVFPLCRRLLLVTALPFCVVAVSGCASQDVALYADRKPIFNAQTFFDGDLTAHGVLKNRSGDVTRQFNATIKAWWKDGVGTLEEQFVFDDGEVQYRTWVLQPAGAGRYRATAGDVVGAGEAQVAGNVMRLQYTLRIDYRGKPLELAVDDWMYLVDGNTIINESVLRKFGFRVGSIQLVIVRRP